MYKTLFGGTHESFQNLHTDHVERDLIPTDFRILEDVYFHGALEEVLGYDQPRYVAETVQELNLIQPMSAHISIVDVNLENVEYNAIGFFWQDKYKRLRGLIVATEDLPAIKYAMECLGRKQFII